MKATRTGLVLPPDEGRVYLAEPDGSRIALGLDGESAPLRHLHGVVVTVTGPRMGRRVLVRDWWVLDAGDGSNGYVGRLVVQGMRVFIEDRNSATLVVLDDQHSSELRPYAGKMVLLIGHVIGPNTVTPVVWRLLEDEG